jgi:hypothetical protein
MDYEGKRSLPIIKMLLNIEQGLTELGFNARRDNDIVECFGVIAWKPRLRIRHEWSAHQRAIELVSTLRAPATIEAEQLRTLGLCASLDHDRQLRFVHIKEAMHDDVDATLLDEMINDNMLTIEAAVEKLNLASRPKSA